MDSDYLLPGVTFDEIDAMQDGYESQDEGIFPEDCVPCWDEAGEHVPAVSGGMCVDCCDSFGVEK